MSINTRLKVSATLCLFISFLYSCTTMPPVSQGNPPPMPVDKIDYLLAQKIDPLLDQAYLAFEQNRLTTPVENNAYLRFLQVLSLHPTNPLALQGITDIAEKYMEWAMDAVAQQQFKKATNYLNKARSVDETHPNIQSVQRAISAEPQFRHITYNLSIADLSQRASRIIDELQVIARQIEKQNSKVVITARNDKEGRWIYQQLNQATHKRVRAIFKLGEIPSVHLLYR